jgi:hypothetical protein
LLVADLFLEKITAGWWLIIQANMLQTQSKRTRQIAPKCNNRRAPVKRQLYAAQNHSA